MPHYVIDATHKLDGEPGILIVYASNLEKAKESVQGAHFTYDVEGELAQRRPTPEEFRKACLVVDGLWFSGFAEEEREWLFREEV